MSILLQACFVAATFLTWTCVLNGQCKINDTSRDSVFIDYAREAMVKVEGEQKLRKGVSLRLHNNSSCAILITTGSIEQFYRPLPPTPTLMQRIRREIDYEIPDGSLVPKVQYNYFTSKGTFRSVGGDDFFDLVLLGNRTMDFEVPLRHLDRRAGGRIDVEFSYLWENESGGHRNVIHTVRFWTGETHENVWKNRTKRASKSSKGMSQHPAHWFAPINDPKKPGWEILPQEAKPGEVILSKRNELGLLSNFAPTPFNYRGKKYASVEGFWQMMLYPEGSDDPRAKAKGVEWKYTRDQVAQMTAFEAKVAGSLAEENMKKIGIDWATFEGKRFPYRSATPGEHYRLILEATRAKVDQNPEVKRVLLATGDLILRPDHYGEPDSPPEWKYYEILMQIRTELQKHARDK